MVLCIGEGKRRQFRNNNNQRAFLFLYYYYTRRTYDIRETWGGGGTRSVMDGSGTAKNSSEFIRK